MERLNEKREALIAHVVTKGLNPNAKMKDSGIDYIGQIPEEWEVRRLKTALQQTLMYGANESAEEKNSYDPGYIRITDIDKNGQLKKSTFSTLSRSKAEPYMLLDGDVLFARSGATVGKTFMYSDSDGEAAFAGYLIRARPNTDICLSRFLNYLTQTGFYFQWIESKLIQATIQNVSADKYNNFYFPAPGVPEQKQIIDYLDKKTNLSKEIEQEIANSILLLKEKREVLITAAVTGKIRITEDMINVG
ncbi:MAG: restriction endonuclease subunit S [Planctomycetes bacterium]|nr:restriction endonuclease subunit S [Planctomycetota bacterium]